MASQAFALSPISARASLPSEEDYDAIREAFMETARGRWFLDEYARRNRNADTSMVLDAVARIEETLAAGKTTVRGVAFNDGSARIEAVELSLDDGRTWRRARLETPASPYAWHPWTAEVPIDRGTHRILARAVDVLGSTQPRDGSIGWNPAGYGWNGVQRVQINVS